MKKTQKKELPQNGLVESMRANMTTHFGNESCSYESTEVLVQEDVKQEEVRGRKRYKMTVE